MRAWIALLGLALCPGLFAQTEDRLEPVEAETPPFLIGDLILLADPADESAPAEMEWLRTRGYDTLVCPFRSRIDYEPGEVECGLIEVPENREVPDSRTITLHFVRIAARGEDHEGNAVEVRDDPVIYLTGGPGVEAEYYVKRLKDHRIAARRDLYILEQRGIGYSGDFCPFFGERNRARLIHPEFEAAQMAFLDAARDCIEQAHAGGVDVSGYHTFENARDIKALRLALGLDAWNVWGISYGSVLGQAYMKVDPEGIRAAVIDAIVPLDLHDLMRIPHWHTRNLRRLFDACAAQDDCALVFDGLEQRYHSAIASIAEQPVALEVQASEHYPGGQAFFFQDLIAGLPFGLLYEQSGHAAVPAVIDGLTRAVERRDQTFFRALALAGTDERSGMGMGMSFAVRCMDHYIDRWAEVAPGDFIEYPALARAFGSEAMIRRAPEVCRELGLAPRAAEDFSLARTDLPVVVANGAWDPITPTPLAEYIMPGFSNGRLVEFPHAGHGPTRSLECSGDFLNAFFDDPEGPLDMDCVESGEDAATYIAPYFRTRAVPRAIVMMEESKRWWRINAAWGGLSLLPAVLGTLLLLFGWLARRLNRQRLAPAGGSRFIVFLAALAASVYAAGLGAAAHATGEVTEAMLLFGLVGWAGWVAWLAPLAGLLGLLGLIQSWRYSPSIPPASRLGLWLVCLGAISLSIFGLVWDLWPL